MFLYTGSTNPGNAICCRPNYFEGVCGGKNGEYQCSQPSFDENVNSLFKNILSKDNKNH